MIATPTTTLEKSFESRHLPLKTVTVFRDRAELQRVFEVTLSQGLNHIVVHVGGQQVRLRQRAAGLSSERVPVDRRRLDSRDGQGRGDDSRSAVQARTRHKRRDGHASGSGSARERVMKSPCAHSSPLSPRARLGRRRHALSVAVAVAAATHSSSTATHTFAATNHATAGFERSRARRARRAALARVRRGAATVRARAQSGAAACRRAV